MPASYTTIVKQKKNKPRLALALYSRPKHPGTYHYALFAVPKGRLQSSGAKTKTSVISPLNSKLTASSTILKFHVKNTLTVNEEDGQVSNPWRFENAEIEDLSREGRLLVLVTVGKILCGSEKVRRILREQVEIYQVGEGDKGKDFDCVSWMRDALGVLKREGLISGADRSWEGMQTCAERFVESMGKEGRWSGWTGAEGVPCWNLLDGEHGVAL